MKSKVISKTNREKLSTILAVFACRDELLPIQRMYIEASDTLLPVHERICDDFASLPTLAKNFLRVVDVDIDLENDTDTTCVRCSRTSRRSTEMRTDRRFWVSTQTPSSLTPTDTPHSDGTSRTSTMTTWSATGQRREYGATYNSQPQGLCRSAEATTTQRNCHKSMSTTNCRSTTRPSRKPSQSATASQSCKRL